MLRVAVVTPMLPVPHDSTRGRYIHETAASLAKLAQVKVFFQTPQYPRWASLKTARSFVQGEVGPDYRLEGLDVEAYTYPALPGLSRALNGEVAGLKLRPRLRRFRPDLVIGYWVYPDAYAALRAARSLGVPCIAGALGSDIHVRDGLNHAFTRYTVRHVDAVVTVSEAMRRATIADFGADAARVHTVVNGYNTAIFRPQDRAAARAALGIDAGDEVLIYVGRFVEAKGLKELVAAFQQLGAQRPRLKLALVGTGVMEARLMQLIDEAGLRRRMLLPGGLEPAEVARWIAASDVLTLPSWSEGYPNVVVEAVACGCPVVATDVGGTREILDRHNGILVPPRDVAALTAGLAQALDGSWDRPAIAASIRRTWDDVARETLAVGRALVEGGVPAQALAMEKSLAAQRGG